MGCFLHSQSPSPPPPPHPSRAAAGTGRKERDRSDQGMSRCCQGISLATSQPHPVVHRHSSAFLQKHTWTSRSAWPMDPGAGPQRLLRDLTSSSHVSLHDGQCRPLSLWETQHPHLRSGNPGWLHTPPQAFLLTLPTFSPLDFSLLGASTCCGLQVKFSKEFSPLLRKGQDISSVQQFSRRVEWGDK